MNQYDLYHTGVKRRSGRYPWGSGARPYQSMERSSSRKSISSFIKTQRAKKQQAAVEKMREEVKRKAAQAAEEKQRHDADKERVLREGSATEVLKYQGELSNQELQNALTRLNLEASLVKIAQKEQKATMDAIDAVMQNVKTVTNWTKIGTDAYNTLVDIYNATETGQENPLTKIGGGGDNKKK